MSAAPLRLVERFGGIVGAVSAENQANRIVTAEKPGYDPYQSGRQAQSQPSGHMKNKTGDL
ncbi:MAG: hypothetical protein GY927_15960 [bacterium]|nr:hypothetical protein [bacterium]